MDIDKKVWEVLFSEEEILNRVGELGKQISYDYRDKNLYIVSLLRGSFVFTADLVRKIDVPVKIDFITTSSYGYGVQTSGTVKIVNDIEEEDLKGYHVLIVDDISDSGLTMEYVIEHLKRKNPSGIKSCVLLDKPERRQLNFIPDYIGFTIPNKFVVGYGLNYGDHYRNIPYVFAVTDKDR
ncbi:MAG TPA: hypoxanthine phosphoribosyltransferase [Clostridia bacterium]|nr:hypoxanthine phosphoribosyltransferase [Clostridia bacterium]